MGLADVVFRRGHLSEDALVEVWTTGVRPAHLDSCEACGHRALDMSRWLEDVQAIGRADAEAVFSDDRLATQRDAVMTRLAQLDRPSKVISFPAAAAQTARDTQTARRGSAGWLLAAAAAGLMIGVVTMELSHMIPFGGAPTPPVVASAPAPAVTVEDASLLDGVFDRPSLGAMHALDEMTPRIADVILVSNRNR